MKLPFSMSSRRRLVALAGTGALVAAGLVAIATPPAQAQGRVANPYAGASVYVNADWQANAQEAGAPASIASQATAVWMDRILAIEGAGEAMGLVEHLDAAVAQGAGVFQVVIYNLPGRDCAALASNGELGPDELGRYQNEYIDVIAEILGRAEYASLRVVAIIEIDSLPNLVTNTGSRPTATPECDEMLANGNYVNGVAYALGTLGALPNVYNYVDIGHHGWLGWDDNFQPFADLMGDVVRTAPAGPEDLHGFASNVANYGVLHEEFFDIDDVVGGRPIREIPEDPDGGWIDWNRYLDEVGYVQAYEPVLAAAIGHDVSMIIDTSRNGWGGADRPTGTSSSTDPVTYMNESRIDRRIHIGNWCNQSGAGLGERPQASPEAGVDAYVWIKPPGESDGSSEFIENDEGKGFDRMCDPRFTEGTPRNANNPSGALPEAPLSGHWFQAQFEELLANAFPAA
jgi:cellulose 1,4-beta-cellobiosidase